jgi:hypothetical protein
LFKNKHFNSFREKMSHLSSREITSLLHEKWKFGTTQDEKDEFQSQHVIEEQGYY